MAAKRGEHYLARFCNRGRRVSGALPQSIGDWLMRPPGEARMDLNTLLIILIIVLLLGGGWYGRGRWW